MRDVSTVILFMELHRRLASYSVGELDDQFFKDIEASSTKAFCELDKAMHEAFESQADTVMQRIADEDS